MMTNDGVLPVFTSPEHLWWFARARHPGGDPARPVALEVDALELVDIAEQLEATAGLERLIFDPKIDTSGRWLHLKDPMSVGSYRRYVLEIAHATKRLLEEGREKLRDEFSDPEELERVVAVWIALQADQVSANARAIAAEWEIEDVS